MANKFYNHTISDFYGHPALDNPDKFGLEIEMEGLPEGGMVFPPVAGWAAHNDGSLRNGIEFVSSGPRNFDDLGGDLANLSQAFAGINFVPVFSYRTSLHVHANVRDLTWVQIANLWSLYTIFEMPLMEMGGEERIGNVHCQAVGDCHEVVDRFKRCFDDKPGKGVLASNFDFNGRIANLCNRDRRYASFNFASIPQFGTVEFRSHRGTMDAKTVLAWVSTILAMKAAARTYPDPQWLVQDFSSKGLEGFAEHVFGPDHYVTRTAGSFQADIWEGLRLAQEVAFSRPAWDKAAKPAKKAKTRPDPDQAFPVDNNQLPADFDNMPGHVRNRVLDNRALANAARENLQLGNPVPDWIIADMERNTAVIQEWRLNNPDLAAQPAVDPARQRQTRRGGLNVQQVPRNGRLGNIQMPADWLIRENRWAMPAQPAPVFRGIDVIDDVGPLPMDDEDEI